MKTFEEIKREKTIKVLDESYDGFACLITINGKRCTLVVSNGGGWEHASISPLDHRAIPTWDDMCKLKDIVWNEDEAVIQIHPRKSDYVNNMPNCLHLWRPTQEALPLPPTMYV